MSADAKIWDEGGEWFGLHDGCPDPESHKLGGLLSEVLNGIETCEGQELFWEFRTYDNGSCGLSGYMVPRG